MRQSPRTVSRRLFLNQALSATAVVAVPRAIRAAELTQAAPPAVRAAKPTEELPPVRVITRGPKHHWFAYYDKLEFDVSGRYLLGMEVDFEHRSPRPDDVIRIGMVDLADGDRWIELDQSRAWCWQQGCMLQWRPGSKTEILFNDRQGDQFVCHILDVKTKAKRTVPHPIYTVSPDGKTAFAPDFRRVNAMRPGYGYVGLPDPHQDELAPKDSGIFRVDLESGKQELIVPMAEIAAIPWSKADLAKMKHWFNHLLVNPDGTRLEFLNRWVGPGKGGRRTRMFTVGFDGSDVRLLDQNGLTSHFIWRDPRHILAWSGHGGPGFYLFEDKVGGTVEMIGQGVMTQDGHCSYLPGNQWIVNDSYPDRQRNQQVYLYHVATGKRVTVGRFHMPAEYAGEWRCDLHPRFSPDGRSLVVDAPCEGQGRQLHLIDIRGVVG